MNWYIQSIVNKNIKFAQITVKPNTQYEGILVPADDSNLAIDFSFQRENEYYKFRAVPLRILQNGFLSYGDRAQYIVVFYDGPEDQMFQTIMKRLNWFKNLSQVPFKTQKNRMIEMLTKLVDDNIKRIKKK